MKTPAGAFVKTTTLQDSVLSAIFLLRPVHLQISMQEAHSNFKLRRGKIRNFGTRPLKNSGLDNKVEGRFREMLRKLPRSATPETSSRVTIRNHVPRFFQKSSSHKAAYQFRRGFLSPTASCKILNPFLNKSDNVPVLSRFLDTNTYSTDQTKLNVLSPASVTFCL